MDDAMSLVAEADGFALDPAAAHARQRAGAQLIDVREAAEFELASALDSMLLPIASLDDAIGKDAISRDAELLVLCATGRRSAAAATRLRELGFEQVFTVAGGLQAWRECGLPMRASALGDHDLDRYARQLILPDVGAAGQARLRDSSVLIIGAGGLGSPLSLYLAAAGVGRLRIVDPDRVERSNLHRQVVHRDDSIGEFKVESAARTLSALNPYVRIESRAVALDDTNADALAENMDVLVDGADNFAARHHLNDAAIRSGKPLVYGAVHRFDGQASVFWPGRPGNPGPCYRCLFPDAPPPELAPNCAEAGVLGVVPGLIGLVQAAETLKLLLGTGSTLVGRLLTVDMLSMRFREIELPRDPDCRSCGLSRP